MSSSSSGIVLHRKYDSRLARAKSSSLPGFSRRNRNSGDTSTPSGRRAPPARTMYFVGQLGLDEGDERLDVVVASPSGERPGGRSRGGFARHRPRGLSRRPPRARGSCRSAPVSCARSPKMRRWLAGGQVSFSGPSTSTHWTASPGPSYLSAPTLCTTCGAGQSVGEDRDRGPRLHVLDELDHGRLVGRGVEVADQVRSCPPSACRRPSTRKVTGLPAL